MLVLMTILTSLTSLNVAAPAPEALVSRNPLRARIDLILNRFETAPGKVTVLAYAEFQDAQNYDESRDNYGFDADRNEHDREENRGPSSEAAPEEDSVVLS
ncbi:MAG: hypothetical protein EOP09_07375 [Proteobacteria bacterium]|nr:MAG: hypothetical protein EOP09_07375 [Pseudomonadota bacterium]